MPNIYLNIPQLWRWQDHNGDYTHSLTYDLNENSTVIDLGGYTGEWAKEIINRYNCNVYLVEPIEESYRILLEKFKSNPKVHILKVGIGIENTEKIIYVNGDSTSFNIETGEAITVEIKTIESVLNRWNLEKIDLLQVNIEGDEYELLQHMIDTGLIDRFNNLQVQFHLGIEDAVAKHESICEGLIKRGFRIKYSYPFVWEAWTKE